MSTHTPGPWKVFTSPNGKIIGIGELTGEGVADCGFGVWRGGDEEALANARLIAAAPELLEACHKLVNNWGNLHHNDLMQLRTAIAKATEG